MKQRPGAQKHKHIPTVTERCGTYGEAQLHSKRGEYLDPACAFARAAYMAEYRHNKDYQARADKLVELGIAQ